MTEGEWKLRVLLGHTNTPSYIITSFVTVEEVHSLNMKDRVPKSERHTVQNPIFRTHLNYTR